MGGVSREQKMLKGHLPRVIYHQVYWYTIIIIVPGLERQAQTSILVISLKERTRVWSETRTDRFHLRLEM